jgi:repressor LexA
MQRLPILGRSAAMSKNRIQQIRKSAGLNADELAKLVGTTTSQLGKLERGERRLSDHWAERIAKHLGVQPYELMMPASTPPSLRFVPVIGSLSCGNWQEAIQTADEHIPTFYGGPNSFALRPTGDSMNRILKGAGYVVIDPDDTDLIDRRFYVVMNEDGEATAKQYRGNPARLEPASDNPEHRAIVVGRHRFTVVGRIVEASGPVESD